MKDSIRKFILSNWMLSEKVLLIADVLLLGVLIGWLTSPFKGGFRFFSNNNLNNNNGVVNCEDEETQE